MRYSELEEEAQLSLTELGILHKKEFDNNELLRRDMEIQWVEDLRQTKGIYDPEVVLKIKNSSKVYPKYTRGKETTLRGKLNNILLPDNDKNWTIGITPKPKLSKEALNEVMDLLKVIKTQRLMNVKNVTEEDKKITREELEKAIKDYAEARCKKMEVEMEDQIIELDYDSIMRDTIKSTIRYGTGVVKGVLSKKVTEVGYEETKEGTFEQVESERHLPEIEFVRLWDWYPDMSSISVDGCDFVWERYVMNKYQLRQLAKRKDFYEDVINVYIQDHDKGDAKYKQWEIDVETLDNKKSVDVARPGKYEVYCRVGLVDTDTLRKIGIEGIKEEEKSVELLANLWLVGDKVIKCVLNPVAGNIMPYHVFYFDKDESNIFGTGAVRIMRDTALTIGGAMRATLNNAAICSGSQVEVNVSLLDYDEDVEDVRPGRIWKRTGKGMEAAYPAVKPVDFKSHIPELMSILDKAMMLGDLEISIPMWMQSNVDKQNKEPLGRLSAKLSSSTVTIKDIAKSFDVCNESLIKALYAWNMEFNKNDDIKGDFSVKAKGAYSLIMQELRFQAVTYFAQSLNEEERLYLKTGKFLRERAKMIDLNPDDFLRSDEEVEQIKQSNIDTEAIALAKEREKAKIANDVARAKVSEAKAAKTVKDSDLETIKALTEE